MRVSELMEKKVTTCSPMTNLEDVAHMMWDSDCGSIPVIDDNGKPVGMITDRDIAMGSAINHKPLWDLMTREITNNRKVFTCATSDDVHEALKIMKNKKIRRLPVVNTKGELQGIISMDDMVVAAADMGKAKKSELSSDEVLHTLQHLCGCNLHYGVRKPVSV